MTRLFLAVSAPRPLRLAAPLFLAASALIQGQTPREREALELLQKGQIEPAQRILSDLLKGDPQNQPVQALLGQIAFGKQQYKTAISHFGKAPAFLANNPVLLLNYAEALLATNALNEAMQALEMIRKDDAVGHFETALLLARFRRFSDAEKQFQAAKSSGYRDTGVLLYNLALTQHRLGRFTESAATLEELSKTQALDADAANLLAQSYLDGGNNERAEAALQDSVRRFPKDERNYVALAKLAIDAEMTEMGLRALDQGLEQLQDSYHLRMQRGYLRLTNSRFDDAEADYRRAIELRPDVPSPKVGLAFVLLQSQRQAEAAAILEQVLIAKPNFFVHYLVAELRIREGSEDVAMEHLHKAAELEPKFSPTHTSLGKLLLRKKEIAKAVQKLELAVKLDPDDTSAYYQLSTAYRLNGDREKSLQALSRVKELNKEQRELGTTHFITRRLRKLRSGESWTF